MDVMALKKTHLCWLSDIPDRFGEVKEEIGFLRSREMYPTDISSQFVSTLKVNHNKKELLNNS